MKKILMTLALCSMVIACSKKNKSDQPVESMAAGGAETKIESTPMNFDAAGSDSGKIEGLSTIHFEYDKSTLTSKTKKELQANSAWLKKNAGVRVQIEGHCDARGSIEYNLALGERRANAVKSYLVSQGVSEARLSVISYGKEKPLVNGDSDEAYAKNRRANFVPVQ